jgi:GrpB-like predicted nucleotidyltransferase (UPF0157 family)
LRIAGGGIAVVVPAGAASVVSCADKIALPGSGSTTRMGAVDEARPKQLKIVDHDDGWAPAFATIGAAIRDRLDEAAVRIDHIGSTAVAGLAAKDVIDIQVTVDTLDVAGGWPNEILPNLVRRPAITLDHLPVGLPSDAGQWAKLYWSNGSSIHLHVREQGRLNQRYALLFRDYLRADPVAAGAYGLLKRALADVLPNDLDTYYAVKDPACDLIIAGAEHWAIRTGWMPGPSDA